MILGSEIGDKTFLIAAVLAMRQPRLLIFTAAMIAMLVMSVLSAFLGHIVPNLLPQRMVDLCTSVLFLVFGLMMLREGWDMQANEQQKELDEVRAELEEKEWHNDDAKETIDMESGSVQVNGKGAAGKSSLHIAASRLLSPVFVQTFILVFLAEWGDRSQFATIAMAAAQDVTATIVGTVAGHAVCTGIAVIGGRLLAQRISVRTVTIAGAALFSLFGIIICILFNGIPD
ncbi:hypothetical protein BDF22DRAFT_620804 [Syncephalis plumigaleata]|nr:hypothetical protein BDF22DRAFT_620804 [Syncephalis plumigaleata]